MNITCVKVTVSEFRLNEKWKSPWIRVKEMKYTKSSRLLWTSGAPLIIVPHLAKRFELYAHFLDSIVKADENSVALAEKCSQAHSFKSKLQKKENQETYILFMHIECWKRRICIFWVLNIAVYRLNICKFLYFSLSSLRIDCLAHTDFFMSLCAFCLNDTQMERMEKDSHLHV